MESRYQLKVDEEKQRPVYVRNSLPPTEDFSTGDSTYAKLQRFAGRYRIEQRGIERVPEDERTDKGLVILGTMVGRSGHCGFSWEQQVLMKRV